MKRLLNGKGRKRETGDLRLETGDEMKESCAAWSAAGRLENLGASKILARHGSMVALRLHGSACAGMAFFDHRSSSESAVAWLLSGRAPYKTQFCRNDMMDWLSELRREWHTMEIPTKL